MDKEKVQSILKKAGLNLESILNSPQALEKASSVVYKTIPIPFRWFVGKKRIKTLILSLKDKQAQYVSSKAGKVTS